VFKISLNVNHTEITPCNEIVINNQNSVKENTSLANLLEYTELWKCARNIEFDKFDT